MRGNLGRRLGRTLGSFQAPSWLVGSLLAVAVALAFLAGLPLLVNLEGRALDLLYAVGRANPPVASPDIVHADIDDSAIETVGRWPWPREQLARAVRTLDHLGARVIALDLLLIDSDEARFTADGAQVLGDEALAAAFAEASARTVLAVKVDPAGTRLGELWTSEEGARLWKRVVDELTRDITLDAETLVERVGLEGERAARVRGRLLGIKHFVIGQAAQAMRRAGRRVTTDALREVLVPAAKNARIGRRFPEASTIERVVATDAAIETIERALPRAHEGAAGPRIESVHPPVPLFARTASAVGVVNAAQDRDGVLRRTYLRWSRGDTVYPQFGAAAAAAFLGEPLDLFVAPQIRTRTTGFRHAGGETMLLSWPRLDPDRSDLGLHRHFSLGRVIALVEAEEEAHQLATAFDTVTRTLLPDVLPDWTVEDYDSPQYHDRVLAEFREQAAAFLDGLAPDDEGDDPELVKNIRALRNWLNLERESTIARAEAEGARDELRDAVQGRLVFIGWNATGSVADFYTTAAHERTPGVVAHAIVANAILTGYVVHAASPALGTLIALLLGIGAALATHYTEPRLGFFLAILIVSLFVTVNTLLVFGTWRVSIATSTPLACIAVAWSGTVAMSAVRALREKAQLRRQFGARISKHLFEYLSENPDLLHLEGEEREVTCFFSDLEGFTSISESLDSRRTVALLNKYMWAMNDEMTKLSAYVNKFLGDGIMAVWGAFGVDASHTSQACRAALACLRRLETLNDSPDFAGLPRLAMRIGIATGVVTVGDCGAPPDLRDYTVIGDAANLAARLESANKQFGTRILINGRAKELLPDDILTRPLGRITVVGQKTPTELHEVVALRAEATPDDVACVGRTTEAVAHFQRGDLESAERAWTALSADTRNAKLARLYLDEIADRRARAEEPFEGVLHLTRK